MELSTSDTDLAAFLVATAGRLPALVPQAESGRLCFVFEGDGDFDALVANFYAGQAVIEPQRYSQARRLLMGRVREVQRQPSRRPWREGARYGHGRTGGSL